jgi:hypothetical protein
MTPLPTRFIEEVGKRTILRRTWQSDQPCHGYQGKHEATLAFPDRGLTDPDPTEGKSWATLPWSNVCDHCNEAAPDSADRSISTSRTYNTTTGRPEPGDLYYRDFRYEGKCWCGWSNCDGFHLHAVLPTGDHWDIDSRASNCTMKDDGLHRCWVRHGDPRKGEPVHVDKNGLTCQAGAGSIVVPKWHGFLHSGLLVSC